MTDTIGSNRPAAFHGWSIIQYAAELARRNAADHEHFYRLLGANADSDSEPTSAP